MIFTDICEIPARKGSFAPGRVRRQGPNKMDVSMNCSKRTAPLPMGRILTPPPLSRLTSRVRLGLIRSLLFVRELLRTRKSALRWQCQDAPLPMDG